MTPPDGPYSEGPPRPWYREPWPWVLIAIPLAAVIASMVTIWLAISRPDPIVVEDAEYERIRSELRALERPGEPVGKPAPEADD